MYIVTGCSSGLGYEITRQLLNINKSVIGISRNLKKTGEFLEKKNYEHISIDLSVENNFNELEIAVDRVPDDDIVLVINAADFHFEADNLLSVAEAKNMFNVNYFSSVALVNNLLNKRLKRILFVNSVAGLNSQKGQAQYSASKHALQAYSEVLAKYSIGRDFDVMSVNPGGINTELWDSVGLLTKDITDNFLKPEMLADIIVKLLLIPTKTYIKSLIILPEHDV
ncbi:SDR family NAD(P)-dependent oxidoreductase [bacterium]|nr:SDR family NAD(P)-dependent oxidoreductase [bacterium]